MRRRPESRLAARTGGPTGSVKQPASPGFHPRPYGRGSSPVVKLGCQSSASLWVVCGVQYAHDMKRIFLLLIAAACLAPARTVDLDSATIADLNAAFNAGTLTSEKLVEMCLARIKAFDHAGPRLNAVMALNP